MTAQENRDLVQRYLGLLSGHPKPASTVNEFVTDPSLKEHIAMFEAAFPSYELLIDDMVAEGDTVAVRATFRGTHRGAFQGLQPTGNTVSVPVMLFYEIDGGKVSRHWMNADVMGLMQQLGAIPAPV